VARASTVWSLAKRCVLMADRAVMPATGKELKVGDIRQEEANIHAGVALTQAVPMVAAA